MIRKSGNRFSEKIMLQRKIYEFISNVQLVADEVVGLGEFVIELARRIAVAGVPIEPRPALYFGALHQIGDQQAAEPMAAEFRRNEQILEITDRRDDPRAFVQERKC